MQRALGRLPEQRQRSGGIYREAGRRGGEDWEERRRRFFVLSSPLPRVKFFKFLSLSLLPVSPPPCEFLSFSFPVLSAPSPRLPVNSSGIPGFLAPKPSRLRGASPALPSGSRGRPRRAWRARARRAGRV